MKIHLIGKGPGFHNAPSPTDDGSYQVWGLNDAVLFKDVDVAFNLHDIAQSVTGVKIAALKNEQDGVPLYSIKKYDWLSTSIEFPLDEVIEKTGIRYFSSSVCYVLAFAIIRGVTEIETWGISFYPNQKDYRQRECVEFWLGFALGKGIKITLHHPTALLQTGKENKLYGYEEIDWENDFDADAYIKKEQEKMKSSE